MGFSPFFFHSGDSFGILMDSLGLQCNFHGSFGILKDFLGCSAIVKDHFMLIPSRNQRTFELLGEGGGISWDLKCPLTHSSRILWDLYGFFRDLWARARVCSSVCSSLKAFSPIDATSVLLCVFNPPILWDSSEMLRWGRQGGGEGGPKGRGKDPASFGILFSRHLRPTAMI